MSSDKGFRNFENMYKCCIKATIVLIFSLSVRVSGYCQQNPADSLFNQQVRSQVGIGFAITSFSSNFTYYVSPHHAFRYKRHWIGISPFYGRLDALSKQQDLGIGIDYRLYPFKNENNTLLYFPAGLHYNYKWTDRRREQGLLYKVGFGVEAFLGKGFSLSLDANFGIGQILNSEVVSGETANFGADKNLSFYFIPVFRVSYTL